MANQLTATAWKRLSATISLWAFSTVAFSCRQIVGIAPGVDEADGGAPGAGARGAGAPGTGALGSTLDARAGMPGVDAAGAAGAAGAIWEEPNVVPSTLPDCEKFCHLELTECSEFPAYESDAQCEAVCNALPRGSTFDQTQNTVGCRLYHSYNSLIDPKTHCSHTGPGGDGHCVEGNEPDAGNCESYCWLLETGCKSDFDAMFADQSACQAECSTLDGAAANSGYSTSATGDNLQCRLLNVSRALSDPTQFCAAALGGAPCK